MLMVTHPISLPVVQCSATKQIHCLWNHSAFASLSHLARSSFARASARPDRATAILSCAISPSVLFSFVLIVASRFLAAARANMYSRSSSTCSLRLSAIPCASPWRASSRNSGFLEKASAHTRAASRVSSHAHRRTRYAFARISARRRRGAPCASPANRHVPREHSLHPRQHLSPDRPNYQTQFDHSAAWRSRTAEEHSFGSVFRSNPRSSLSNPPFERKLVGSAVPSPRTLSGSFFSLLNRTRYGSVRELRGEHVVRGRRGGEEEVNSSHLTAAAGPNCAGTKRGWRQRLRRAFLPPQVRFRRFGGGRKTHETERKRMS